MPSPTIGYLNGQGGSNTSSFVAATNHGDGAGKFGICAINFVQTSQQTITSLGDSSGNSWNFVDRNEGGVNGSGQFYTTELWKSSLGANFGDVTVNFTGTVGAVMCYGMWFGGTDPTVPLDPNGSLPSKTSETG